jgi:hypothetical protein
MTAYIHAWEGCGESDAESKNHGPNIVMKQKPTEVQILQIHEQSQLGWCSSGEKVESFKTGRYRVAKQEKDEKWPEGLNINDLNDVQWLAGMTKSPDHILPHLLRSKTSSLVSFPSTVGIVPTSEVSSAIMLSKKNGIHDAKVMHSGAWAVTIAFKKKYPFSMERDRLTKNKIF